MNILNVYNPMNFIEEGDREEDDEEEEEDE